MPWTTPETFTAGQTLTAASMNAQSENLRVLRALANVQQTVVTGPYNFNVAQDTLSAAGDTSALEVSITPTATTSKVLVRGVINLAVSSDTDAGLILYRNGSALDAATGSVSSNRRRSTLMFRAVGFGITLPFVYLDSPATTSAVTYGFRLWHGAGATITMRIGQSQTDTDSVKYGRTASMMVAQEIPA